MGFNATFNNISLISWQYICIYHILLILLVRQDKFEDNRGDQKPYIEERQTKTIAESKRTQRQAMVD